MCNVIANTHKSLRADDRLLICGDNSRDVRKSIGITRKKIFLGGVYPELGI